MGAIPHWDNTAVGGHVLQALTHYPYQLLPTRGRENGVCRGPHESPADPGCPLPREAVFSLSLLPRYLKTATSRLEPSSSGGSSPARPGSANVYM